MAKGKYENWLRPENLIRIQGWARDGLTDEQIAHNMGVGCSTLYKWKNDHLEILEALKEGKDVADRAVENALYKSAIGYEYDEVTTTTFANGKTEIKVTRKKVPPSITAQIFWLKNRKPKEWRDRVGEDTAAGTVVPVFTGEDDLK